MKISPDCYQSKLEFSGLGELVRYCDEVRGRFAAVDPLTASCSAVGPGFSSFLLFFVRG